MNKEFLKLNASLERSRIEKKCLDETLLALKDSFESYKGNARKREDSVRIFEIHAFVLRSFGLDDLRH